jgi:hypothetical protein
VAAAAAFGIRVEDDLELDDDEYWLWPENDAAFALWLSLQTQWNVGMKGVTGLHYPGVEACMRLRGTRPKERAGLFGMVQMMEQVCLEEWAQQ